MTVEIIGSKGDKMREVISSISFLMELDIERKTG